MLSYISNAFWEIFLSRWLGLSFFSSEIVEIHISAKTWRHVKSTLLRLCACYSPPCFGNHHPTEHQRCKVENKTLNSIRRTTAAQLKTGDKNWKLSFWNTIFREKYKEKKSCKCAINANDHKGEFLLLWIINRMMHMMSLKTFVGKGVANTDYCMFIVFINISCEFVKQNSHHF